MAKDGKKRGFDRARLAIWLRSCAGSGCPQGRGADRSTMARSDHETPFQGPQRARYCRAWETRAILARSGPFLPMISRRDRRLRGVRQCGLWGFFRLLPCGLPRGRRIGRGVQPTGAPIRQGRANEVPARRARPMSCSILPGFKNLSGVELAQSGSPGMPGSWPPMGVSLEFLILCQANAPGLARDIRGAGVDARGRLVNLPVCRLTRARAAAHAPRP